MLPAGLPDEVPRATKRPSVASFRIMAPEYPKAALLFAAILMASGAALLWVASTEASFSRRALETVGHVRSIGDCDSGGTNAPPTCHVSMTYTVEGRTFDVDRRVEARPEEIRFTQPSRIVVSYDPSDPSEFYVVPPDPGPERFLGIVFLVFGVIAVLFAIWAWVRLRRPPSASALFLKRQ